MNLFLFYIKVSEFATENLLFIVEYSQIKHLYQLQNNNVIKINKKSDFVVIDLAGNENKKCLQKRM